MPSGTIEDQIIDISAPSIVKEIVEVPGVLCGNARSSVLSIYHLHL